MQEYWFFYLAFAVGVFWFLKKIKKKEVYHYYTLFFVLGLNLNYPPFSLTRNTQWALILMSTAFFMLYDLSYKKKIKGVWRYALAVLVYGVYLSVA